MPRNNAPERASTERKTERDWLRVAGALFVGSLAVLFVLLLIQSFGWRMEHDTPLMHYIAYQVLEHGRVPYRDIFDMNFPGTLAVHLLIGRTLGFGDRAIVIASLIVTALLGLIGWGIMRPLDRRAAVAGPLLFGVMYYGYGPGLMLQREVLLLVPASAAVLCTLRHWRPAWPGHMLMGVLAACATTIKPQAVILVPILLVFAVAQPTAGPRAGWVRRLVRVSAPAALGFLVPWGAVVLWLAAVGALGDFVSLVRGYLPIYGTLSGALRPLTAGQRVEEMLRVGRPLHGRSVWAAPALLGAYVILQRPAGRVLGARVWLLLTVFGAFLVYPFISGQFWLYHMMPLLYFGALAAGLCLGVPESSEWRQPGRWLPLIAVVSALGLTLNISPASQAQFRGQAPPPPKGGRVDAIAEYLRAHAAPGDTAQALDVTAGAIHALLEARVPSATSFIYDFHFYHHVSRPYIQDLRRRFVRELTGAQPRFIIQGTTEDKWPKGTDTSRDFPELQGVLDEFYRPAFSGDGFTIYERKAATTSRPARAVPGSAVDKVVRLANLRCVWSAVHLWQM